MTRTAYNRKSPEYRGYIESEQWKALSRGRKRAVGGRCEKCGKKSRVLHAHHRTYERFGAEQDGDIEVLCPGCHKKADRARKRAMKKRVERARFEARLDGWAIKVYGDRWERRKDRNAVEKEFKRWLKSKGLK